MTNVVKKKENLIRKGTTATAHNLINEHQHPLLGIRSGLVVAQRALHERFNRCTHSIEWKFDDDNGANAGNVYFWNCQPNSIFLVFRLDSTTSFGNIFEFRDAETNTLSIPGQLERNIYFLPEKRTANGRHKHLAKMVEELQ